MSAKPCHLCEHEGGLLVWQEPRLRVVRVVDTPDHPAFYRVIWQAHVPELSDLAPEDLLHCMQAVVRVERVLRERLQPTKINLAALGNMVPHLHWHVIARFDWDNRFPAPVWSAAQHPADEARLSALRGQLRGVDRAMEAAFAAG